MRVNVPAPATARTSRPANAPRAVDRDAARATRPVPRLVATWLVAYAALTAVCVGLGLLVTEASLTAGLRRWDVSVNRWFVHQRTATLDSLTAVGSHLAETPTVIGIGLVVVGLV